VAFNFEKLNAIYCENFQKILQIAWLVIGPKLNFNAIPNKCLNPSLIWVLDCNGSDSISERNVSIQTIRLLIRIKKSFLDFRLIIKNNQFMRKILRRDKINLEKNNSGMFIIHFNFI